MNFTDHWLPTLPKTWSAKPLRAIASCNVSSVDKIPADDELPVRLANYTDVYKNEFISAGMELMRTTAAANEIEKFSLRRDDVIITKDSESWDDIGIPSLVVDSAEDLLCGYHLAILRPDKSKLDGRYLFRCLQAKDIRIQLELAADGVTRFGIPKEAISKLQLPVPPSLAEQRAIAEYLDHETARLRSLVVAKENWLELLAEKRRALITHAVTRGLNPKAPLQDSGIAFFGQIPKHWQPMRLKFLTKERLAYGKNEVATENNPSFPRFVRITDVDADGNLRDATFKSLPPEVAQPFLLEDGDVLLARSGATVGKAFIYKRTWGKACFAGYLIRFRGNLQRINPDFVFAFTQTDAYWSQVREGTIQATIQNFSAEKYGDVVIPLAPPEEQSNIVAYISKETAKLDALRKATERTIALLKERRAALIAAAVTGKIQPPPKNDFSKTE